MPMIYPQNITNLTILWRFLRIVLLLLLRRFWRTNDVGVLGAANFMQIQQTEKNPENNQN